MIYIPKRDRAIVSAVERAINEVLGVDKDVYMSVDDLPRGTIKIARYVWIYMVYDETTLGVVDIAGMMGRNHSNIVRAIAVVKKWIKGRNNLEKKIIKEIYERKRIIQESV